MSLRDLLGGVKLRSDDNPTFSQALSQGMPASFDSVASFQSAVTQLKTMADTVDALGVAVSKFNSDGTVTVSGFTTATGDLRTALDTMLNGKTVSTSDLQSQVATITEFVTNTMPNLMKATVNGQQSWVDQMETLKKTYEAAASQASSYGLDGNALNDKFSTLYRQGYEQNMLSLSESAQSVQARLLAAQGNQEGADLANFDLSAMQQQRQLAESWKGFLGEAYAGNETYLQQAADLEKTLGAERLAIQKQYADKAADAAKQAAEAAKQEAERAAEQARQQRDQAESSAASVVSNLLDFAKGLNVSSYSPLSAEAQYRAPMTISALSRLRRSRVITMLCNPCAVRQKPFWRRARATTALVATLSMITRASSKSCNRSGASSLTRLLNLLSGPCWPAITRPWPNCCDVFWRPQTGSWPSSATWRRASQYERRPVSYGRDRCRVPARCCLCQRVWHQARGLRHLVAVSAQHDRHAASCGCGICG
ncbi:hypothetical protein [Asaia prunellae]|uniref:hypothetical protein n=1 Tax=Asaia prunellae TaxID=610245 RepID=UPI000472C06F|nr:hypothetical protein [Asaia prunellae]